MNLCTGSVICGCGTSASSLIDWQWKSELRTGLNLLCEVENECWSQTCQILWLQGSRNKSLLRFFLFTGRKSLQNSPQERCPYKTRLGNEQRPKTDLGSSSKFPFYILKLDLQIQTCQWFRVWAETAAWWIWTSLAEGSGLRTCWAGCPCDHKCPLNKGLVPELSSGDTAQ